MGGDVRLGCDWMVLRVSSGRRGLWFVVDGFEEYMILYGAAAVVNLGILISLVYFGSRASLPYRKGKSCFKCELSAKYIRAYEWHTHFPLNV